jgi:hypothetical protein
MTKGRYEVPFILHPIHCRRWKYTSQAKMVRLSSNQNSYSLISVAGCRECKASTSEDNSGGKGNSAETSNALELVEGTDAKNDITPVESLEIEVRALKARCNMLEKTVRDLQSMWNTHQNYIEAFRKEIISIQSH